MANSRFKTIRGLHQKAAEARIEVRQLPHNDSRRLRTAIKAGSLAAGLFFVGSGVMAFGVDVEVRASELIRAQQQGQQEIIDQVAWGAVNTGVFIAGAGLAWLSIETASLALAAALPKRQNEQMPQQGN